MGEGGGGAGTNIRNICKESTAQGAGALFSFRCAVMENLGCPTKHHFVRNFKSVKSLFFLNMQKNRIQKSKLHVLMILLTLCTFVFVKMLHALF